MLPEVAYGRMLMSPAFRKAFSTNSISVNPHGFQRKLFLTYFGHSKLEAGRSELSW